jgi:hypothetical protein
MREVIRPAYRERRAARATGMADAFNWVWSEPADSSFGPAVPHEVQQLSSDWFQPGTFSHVAERVGRAPPAMRSTSIQGLRECREMSSFRCAMACPCCGAATFAWTAWLIEDFERWYCACGATGRRIRGAGSRLEEVPLPASLLGTIRQGAQRAALSDARCRPEISASAPSLASGSHRTETAALRASRHPAGEPHPSTQTESESPPHRLGGGEQ